MTTLDDLAYKEKKDQKIREIKKQYEEFSFFKNTDYSKFINFDYHT